MDQALSLKKDEEELDPLEVEVGAASSKERRCRPQGKDRPHLEVALSSGFPVFGGCYRMRYTLRLTGPHIPPSLRGLGDTGLVPYGLQKMEESLGGK